ncbi:D-glycero-beta-D-manno-heptose 1,7-bisphosphate 7-phosphatase [Trichlorobacter ammonificans]|uniref:D,D-heptose 1,7-bisphosphate phosphatase n=1 Tax=Trichlorobacter ammonificans TaxID=2916410 RepID=A0ABN8HGT9_9BACT|nr:D-glycero-beta-D-manno-heptose 1,7-bisphosphate 7-phosphatase [Trichlorobacter ammonificans]CAH2030686.1 D-glycero-alpha-D-manno-heptose-1, 7-bisphosphate 7-phosphatase [Trichlorobacter ammonificans]
MSNLNRFIPNKRAVFLDRDGTLNIEKEYLFRIEEFEFVPGAVEAIRLLNRAGLLVVVVTNQSGIARGYYSEADLQRLHRHVDALLTAEGARVDAWYHCPHHPDGREPYRRQCDCRKPLPGMLWLAAREHGIDLATSWMVGDKAADVVAGLAAGCRPLLVLTGYGAQERELVPGDVPCCTDILEAVRLITAV